MCLISRQLELYIICCHVYMDCSNLTNLCSKVLFGWILHLGAVVNSMYT